jgi:hypothetical protein
MLFAEMNSCPASEDPWRCAGRIGEALEPRQLPKEQVKGMIAMFIQQAAVQLLNHAASVIPDPPPAAPVGSGAIATLFSWLKWGALTCCGGAAVTGGCMIALGNTSRRAEMAERGKVTLFSSVIGAVVVGVAVTLITASYGLS